MSGAVLIWSLYATATVLQYAVYWPQLPERVATHFGPGGEPNDWMDKSSAVLLLGGFQIFFPLLLFGVVRVLKWVPMNLINIPHREYWLAAERREASLRWLERPMGGVAMLTGCLLMVTGHFTFRANVHGGRLEEFPFFVCLVAYLAGVVWLVICILRRFGRLPQ